jgi:tetratricopeptide (TPR) repeat protein
MAKPTPPNPPAKEKSAGEPTPRLTLCLAMDLKASTSTGLSLSSRKLDRFNLALVNHIRPQLQSVQLDHAVVKFTGDGWLVMSDEQEDAARLCCLAMIMSRSFQQDMTRETGISIDSIPVMRLAVCWGRDIPVTLHTGQRDFVGSSVRHAVRASQFCKDNEVLIDDAVKNWVAHDFVTRRLDLEERKAIAPLAKLEEELTLHVLEELRPEAAVDPDAPVYFVNTLSVVGRAVEAESLANRISDQLLRAAGVPGDQAPLLSRWNALLASNLDYDTARGVLNDLRLAGLRPDVNTFNALIEKGVDSRSQSKWLEQMIHEGIQPTATTINALIRSSKDDATVERRLNRMQAMSINPDIGTLSAAIDKASNFETATRWMTRLQQAGIKPDPIAYDLLIRKAESFVQAKELIDRMMAERLHPLETTFIELFSKDLSGIGADDLLRWYLGLSYHPTHPVKRAIANYRRANRLGDALRLALDYPHTDTAKKTIRKHSSQALEYFRSVVEANPNHANGTYALGMALLEVGEQKEADQWLNRAYTLATPGTRKDELARLLNESRSDETPITA